MVLGAVACDCDGSDAEPTQPTPAQASDGTGQGKENEEMAQDSEQPSSEAKAKASMSRAQLVERILAPDLASLKPDQVAERFAPLEFARHDELPNSFLLVAKNERELLKVGFRREKGGPYEFAYLRLDAHTPDGEVAKEWYKELHTMVTARLGDPTWVKDDAPFLARAFKLDDKLDANVGAILNDAEGRPYAAISISERTP